LLSGDKREDRGREKGGKEKKKRREGRRRFSYACAGTGASVIERGILGGGEPSIRFVSGVGEKSEKKGKGRGDLVYALIFFRRKARQEEWKGGRRRGGGMPQLNPTYLFAIWRKGKEEGEGRKEEKEGRPALKSNLVARRCEAGKRREGKERRKERRETHLLHFCREKEGERERGGEGKGPF